MKILAIETSCDETSAAVIDAKTGDKKVKIVSNIVASSLSLYSKTGGIVPEVAAREQLKYIIPVIEKALAVYSSSERSESRSNNEAIDAIAVTVGPGLIGSLLVGVETAKTLAYTWNKPIVAVNHLIGHIYANWVAQEKVSEGPTPRFPCITLIVSGGHTDLVLIKDHRKIKWLGGTRDDAAGEALDKIGRLLRLPYPGGPAIEQSAKNGNPKAFHFPRPMIHSNDFSGEARPGSAWDFSFSGLKTAVWREVKKIKDLNNKVIADICASTQRAIVDVLIMKTLKAAKTYEAKSILLAGGVAANQKLRDDFKLYAKRYTLNAKIFAPPKNLCTDNAAMIASAAFFNYKEVPWQKVTANPELYFD